VPSLQIASPLQDTMTRQSRRNSKIMWMPAGEMSLARGKLVVDDDGVSHKDGRPAPSSAGPDRHPDQQALPVAMPNEQGQTQQCAMGDASVTR